MFEVTTIQTQQGKCYTHVPVKDTLPILTSSPNASPLKKQTWPLDVVENEDYDNMTTDQTPKHSRTTGKVSMNTHIYSIIIRKTPADAK